MDNQTNMLRTCIVCGLKKPLNSFLQLTEDQGHFYGDVCATCRSEGREPKKTGMVDPTDDSGGTTRQQLDNKMRIKKAEEIQEEFKQTTEKDHEEKTKKETLESEKKERTDLREKADKKQRESLNSTSSFLSNPRTINANTPNISGNAGLVTKSIQERMAQGLTQVTVEAQNQQVSDETLHYTTTDDPNVRFIDDPHTTSLRRTGLYEEFRSRYAAAPAFRSRQGKDPMGRVLEAYKKSLETQSTPAVKAQNTPTKSPSSATIPDPVSALIKNTRPR